MMPTVTHGAESSLGSEPVVATPSISRNRPERGQSVNQLTAAHIMRRPLICARPSQSLIEAERLLINARIGGLPVVEDGRLVGVLSRSDIARVSVLTRSLDGQVSDALSWDAQADGFQHAAGSEFEGFRRRTESLQVRDAMRAQAVTCKPETPVRELAATMIRNHVHRVIVVEGDRPVGIISSLDIVELVADANA